MEMNESRKLATEAGGVLDVAQVDIALNLTL